MEVGRSMGAGQPRRAVAFAPSHVTGLFSPAKEARDPRGRGSLGAGVVLELGVHATGEFLPGARTRFRLTSDTGRHLEISEEAGRRLLGKRPGLLHVHLTHDLPLRQGFGSSAAGATATALVTARLLGIAQDHAFEVAHLCDLFGGGGLGGVAAILGGGWEVRLRPGIPPYGRIVHGPFPDPLLVGVVGGSIPSPAILSNPRLLARIREAADGLDQLGTHSTPEEFLELSERFTDRVGFASSDLRTVLSALRRRGARAAQAMFGRSFFAVAPTPSVRRAILDWLEAHGVRAVEIRAARRGAHLETSPGGKRGA